jgi:protein-L-isoaspartate(D-aspartate) O-methyltransferase
VHSAAERVAAALEAVPRKDFLPRAQRAHSDRDAPLPIGHGQTNSQPTTVRTMLELLEVCPGDRVLDVGTGSGWTTGLLAWLTGRSGSVVGVERVPDLLDFGAQNVRAAGMPWARLYGATPGALGCPAYGPYDRILVSAQAPSLPAELVAQLAPGGVLVMPVAGRLLRVWSREHGPVVEEHGWYRFVPLVADRPAGSGGPAGSGAPGGPAARAGPD